MSTDPTYIDPKGRVWKCFAVEFDTQEGLFSVHVWAIDMAHAIERVEELKATARVAYQIEGIIQA